MTALLLKIEICSFACISHSYEEHNSVEMQNKMLKNNTLTHTVSFIKETRDYIFFPEIHI